MKVRKLLCSTAIMMCMGLGFIGVQAKADEYKPLIEGENTSKWILDFQEEFNEDTLNPHTFSDLYLPHWSKEELVHANYSLGDGKIKLMIDQHQPGWMPGTKQQISGIQTGMKDGLHIWNSSLGISGHYPAVNNYATKYGYFELRAKAQKGGGIHSAWWMIGTQNEYDKSAEVDIFEILGKDIYSNTSKVWVTIHPWYDTVIRTQRLNYWVNTDISADYHTYGFEWLPTGMKWYFDGKLVRETNQSPDYKMYTLLGIYQSWGNIFSWQGPVDESQPYPKSFDIDYFRVYKTRELLDADKEELAKEAEHIKTHPEAAAIFGGDFTWDWYHQPGHLNDGKMHTTLQSANHVKLPVHIYADFKEARRLSGMKLYTHYGKGQGITDFTVEYKDFDGEWKEIAKVENHQWQKNSTEMEMLSIPFDKTVASSEFRIKVLKANWWWNHFAINEIEFWK